MAIKAGQILHVANQFVVDRLQTGGAGNLNIPTEKIYELGNRQSVAVVRDVPDLTFTMDALDVSTEIEAILTGKNGDGGALSDPTPDAFGLDGTSGTKYDLASYKPIDVVSPWRTSNDGANWDAVRGVAIPNLSLESVSYRYGLRDNAGESFSLRGDSIFYIPGNPYMEEVVATAGQTAFTFAAGNLPDSPGNTALIYKEQGNSLYALSVSINGARLTPGVDYTETGTGFTLAVGAAVGDKVRFVYGSAKPKSYLQDVHQGVAVKPAAIRGKDIQVFIGDTVGDGSGAPLFWTGVQSVNIDWRVTLEDDYEFGNPRAVARDFADVPAVTGSIELKPATVDALFTKMRQIGGVASVDEIIGPNSSVALPLEIRLLNPESGGIPKGTDIPGGVSGTDVYDYGTVLKTLYIPDARFTLPGYEGRVQQKYTGTINVESDTGVLEVFRGRRF